MRFLPPFVLLGAWAVMPSPSALSAPPSYCTPVSQLTERLSSCTDNEVLFGDAAVQCLDKFDEEVEASTGALSRVMLGAGVSAADTKNQEKFFQGSEKNYQETALTLAALISTGKQAVGQIAEYRESIALPEDIESAPDMGFTPEAFLASIPCYSDNRELLLQVAQDFAQKIGELEKVRDLVAAKAKAAGLSKKDVGASSNAPAVAATKGKSSALPKVGPKPKDGQSDITGTNRVPPDLNSK